MMNTLRVVAIVFVFNELKIITFGNDGSILVYMYK